VLRVIFLSRWSRSDARTVRRKSEAASCYSATTFDIRVDLLELEAIIPQLDGTRGQQ